MNRLNTTSVSLAVTPTVVSTLFAHVGEAQWRGSGSEDSVCFRDSTERADSVLLCVIANSYFLGACSTLTKRA